MAKITIENDGKITERECDSFVVITNADEGVWNDICLKTSRINVLHMLENITDAAHQVAKVAYGRNE